MGRFTANILRQFRAWERTSQIAFAIAQLLLIPALGVVLYGPEDLRGPATGSSMGLIIASQLIFMWANRNMITDYAAAQRHYQRGEFAKARDRLETRYHAETANSQELTLLGNTYRQLGDLVKSEQVLLEALDIQPNHYFPLYGFGRTLLVQGRYAEAAQAVTQAIENGGPPVVGVDVGEAYYRLGQHEDAINALQAAQAHTTDEPHRALLVAYLLHHMGQGDGPDQATWEAGLPYWQAEADRYAHTPYGEALADDVQRMTSLY